MSDTPRCDEVFCEAQDVEKSTLVVPLDFARTLERELAEATAEVGVLLNLRDDLMRQLASRATPCEHVRCNLCNPASPSPVQEPKT